MKKIIATALLSASFVLVACAPANTASDPMSNPLYAEWYTKDLVESMMSLGIRNDAILTDSRIKEKVASIGADAQQKSEKAASIVAAGKKGVLVAVSEEGQGRALIADSTLYFGPDTNVRPGHDLHVYLTSVEDPGTMIGTGATVRFPDRTAVDLGVMRITYGISSFAVPKPAEGMHYYTLVLWDKTLKRMHAFAQLR